MSLPAEIEARLRPWQLEPANRLFEILRSGGSALDASDTGTGKTFTATAVASALQRPTLVTCPKIACAQWEAAAEHFNDSFSIVGHELLRAGSTPFGQWEHPLPADKSAREYLVCVICQCKVDPKNPLPCHANAADIHCVEVRKRKHRYGKFQFHSAVKLLIIDEVQKFNATDSLNAQVLIAAKRQKIPTLALSATPGESPLHFKGLGYLLGLHNLDKDVETLGGRKIPSFFRWAARYGARNHPLYRGLHWPVAADRQAEVMRELNTQIFPSRGVRVRRSEIPGFPEVEITAELYNLEDGGRLDRAYAEMKSELQILADKQLTDKAPDSELTILLRAQQRVELLKVPLFVELAEKYRESGHSVGIFVNFHQTIDALAEKLGTDCIIDGRTKHRQRNIDRFQANSERLILVQTAAGGAALSLHDLHGGFPRGGLVSAGFSARALKQLLGRFPRDGGKSPSFYRIIFAAGTVEADIQKAVSMKLRNLDSLIDGDLIPSCQ